MRIETRKPSRKREVELSMDEICLNCKWHTYERASQGWVCCNGESEYIAEWTEPDFTCEEYQERDSEVSIK